MKSFPTDDELTVKLRKGDVQAFDQVYEKYAGRLYGFTLKYLKSKQETEELVQSVFLKVWENHQNLRRESSLKSYLFTIAYHEICNIFRRRTLSRDFVDRQLAEGSDITIETEEQIDYNSIVAQIDQIVAQLPQRQRTVYLKSRQEGKSSKEIAAELGISTGTVDNYLSESLKFIRKNLQNGNFSLLLLFSLFFN